MIAVTANNARKDLFRLMDQTVESHEPVVITGKTKNVVMLSEEDWHAVEEILYLSSVPRFAKELGV